MPFIPKTKRGFVPTVSVAEIVNAILKAENGGEMERDVVKAQRRSGPFQRRP